MLIGQLKRSSRKTFGVVHLDGKKKKRTESSIQGGIPALEKIVERLE